MDSASVLELLDLIMDMDAEGVPHSQAEDNPCGCEQCGHYGRAAELVTKHAEEWKRLTKELAQ